MSNDAVRYPIGRFVYDAQSRDQLRGGCIEQIRSFPDELHGALHGLDEHHLELRYREGGWTLRQLIHHLADGHGNSFYRFKLALTEPEPPVKTWEETLWAETPDATLPPIDASLRIIEGTHARWAVLLDAMSTSDFAKIYRHPQNGYVSLDWLLQYMAWHGEHHLGHIAIVRELAGARVANA